MRQCTVAGVRHLAAARGHRAVWLILQLVGQRTRDIGLRMAPGACWTAVLTEILHDGLKSVGAGLVVGISGVVVPTRVVESLLFGVKPGDVATYGAVANVLALTGAAACAVPALRATRKILRSCKETSS